MQPSQPIFREKALAKLASPEELDRLMPITSVGNWLLLGGLGGIVLIILLWAVFGTLTTEVAHAGMLVSNPTPLIVRAILPGQITEILVAPGDDVTEGQIIARLNAANEEGELQSVDVTSPSAGRVLTVRTEVSVFVSIDTPILSLTPLLDADSMVQTLNGVMFIPVEEAALIQPGMEARLLPIGVAANEHGYLIGRVDSVGDTIASTDEIAHALGSREAANVYAGQPVIAVRIALDTTADGNYRWTLANREARPLYSGTPCNITLILSEERPISRIFNGS